MSLALVMTLLVSTVVGCNKSTGEIPTGSIEVGLSVTPTQIVNGSTPTPKAISTVTPVIMENLSGFLLRKKELFTSNPSAFVQSVLQEELEQRYECFEAIVELENGTLVPGLAYTDFGSYFETEDGTKGFFPAGFVSYGDFGLSASSSQALEIRNLNYTHDKYGFVLAYETPAFQGHCVINGQYVTYDLDSNGLFSFDQKSYSREICDESRGALYSYDEGRYLFNPNLGEFVGLTGETLSETFDFEELEKKINQVLEEQDVNFSQVDYDTCFSIAQEAVTSYLLSLQQETFLGYHVSELVKEANELTPNQCFRITSDGLTVIDIKPAFSSGSSAFTKWLVGASSAIVVVGCLALTTIVPVTRPLTSAITGAAIEVFMQVVVKNNGVDGIQWSKVAVAAISGAAIAWICPLGASKITGMVTNATKRELFGKLAGYGFKTCGNAVIGGATNALMAAIDGKDDTFDAFKSGATLAAVLTILASVASEGGGKLLNSWIERRPNGWLARVSSSISSFIGRHQVHLKNQTLEDILNPKTVYQAARAAANELSNQFNSQGRVLHGGKYHDVQKYSVSGVKEAHEIPPFSATGETYRYNNPSVLMDKADHQLTAGWGSSVEAREYRRMVAEMWQQGKTKEVIELGIQDLRIKFGTKYENGIQEMIAYATEMGWY